ncbi:Activator of Hsp90 ATPase homolog 1-like protein [Blastococcus aurantiacus]|uniref:Activator of Hsp90 ATPase homolog 1-like protein n=1 Tax=Blastococcus aurantiacus TaxID=1550231 RepID=A0A1G7J7K6_9ACTN|nr:SRPBCC domain-containing protein [Blastococcus aurantiacus]SDF20853.1 Activator of Hsp90 ATPase homolog 1-like protein [Blastococcus aurantiacus]
MSSAEAVPDNVRSLRPPIRQSTLVRSGAEHTFAVFTGRLADWWPLVPFSVGRERVREVTLEPRAGGRVYETWDDGTTHEWGQILEWQPPSGLTMTWNATGTPTCVELRFTALAARLTEVQLEHRGWDALTDRELGEDCALPGGYLGGSFAQGWATILGRLQDAAATTEPAE